MAGGTKGKLVVMAGGMKGKLVASMPYIGMTVLQLGMAGMNIVSVVSLNHGLTNYTLVVYRHIAATIVMAPFAIICERNMRPKITLIVFLQMFLLGLLGPVIDSNLYYAGMKYTSTTFTSAISNITPAMVFLMAYFCRMEKVNIKKLRSQAKILGTLLTVAGATVMTLYKGPRLHMGLSGKHHAGSSGDVEPSSRTDYVKGSIMLIVACLSWSAFFLLQAVCTRRYPAQLSLTTMICFIGTIEGTVLALVMERKAGSSVWALGWDNRLVTIVYSGIVCSGLSFYIQGLVMEQKGPVFATAFFPLSMVFQVIMSSPILHESIYMGGVIGGIVIVVGLYLVLWGKNQDHLISPPAPAEPAEGAGNGPKTIDAQGRQGGSVDLSLCQSEDSC